MNLQKTYPNVAQSWGITGITILVMIALSPLQMVLLEPLGMSLTTFITYILTMAAPFAFAHFIRKKETGISKFDFSLSTPKLIVLVSVTALALQVGILSPITSLIPMPDLFKQIILQVAELKGVFAFLTLVIAAPIFEELIFRGIILDGLLKKYSPRKAIFVSSFLFGIVHLNPWQFIAAMGLGILMGWIYHKTNKLSLCMIIHFANNLFAFIGMQMVNMEEELEKSFFEGYGGELNAAMAIGGGTLVFILGAWLLKKEFKKIEIPSNSETLLEENV